MLQLYLKINKELAQVLPEAIQYIDQPTFSHTFIFIKANINTNSQVMNE